jgi:hypothetical protein
MSEAETGGVFRGYDAAWTAAVKRTPEADCALRLQLGGGFDAVLERDGTGSPYCH